MPGLAVALDIAPMEAKLVSALPTEIGWRFEPKWDGFRCLAFRDGENVELRSKSGKPLGRYFPDVVAMLRALPTPRFVVDGELTIPVAGVLSFEALQMRLHPAASRVNRLAAETPSTFVLFDCLLDENAKSLLYAPLSQRREALEALFERIGHMAHIRLSPTTGDRTRAQDWLDQTGAALDGVVAKRSDDPYLAGERAMLKVKRIRTADCLVGGFRYAKDSDQVGSLLLGLYDEAGRLDHVGFTSSISDAERPALTRRLKVLAGGQGFDGKSPGGPSRWSTDRSAEWTPVKPKLVAEVRYDQVTGDRFRHGTAFLRWRPDKAPAQCTMAQLRAESCVFLGEDLMT